MIRMQINQKQMIQSESTQKVEQNIAYVGIDVGGTSSKIAVLMTSPLKTIKHQIKISLAKREEEFYLYTETVNSIEELNGILTELRKELGPHVKVCGTGGGTMLHSEHIKQLLEAKVIPLSQFQAHARGLEFYKNAELPTREQLYFKKSQNQIVKTTKQFSLGEYKQLILMSLGSGVNFQLYGEGEKGYERQKTKDPNLTKSGDGYFLEGTSLGAGFLMGVGKLCTGETEYGQILAKMRQQGQLKQIYQAFFVNLFLMAINLAQLHQRNTLIISGKLLSFQHKISDYFIQALKQSLGVDKIQIRIVYLTVLQGFLGAIGAIQNILHE